MAHTLTPSDLLHPKGDLPLTLFPDKTTGKTANDVLTLWLDEAQGKVASVAPASQNDAALHYVYARAYRAQEARLGTLPNKKSEASSQLMSVGEEWGDNRIQYWKLKAEAEEAKYSFYFPIVPPPKPSFSFNVF